MELDKCERIDFEPGQFPAFEGEGFDVVELKYDGNYSKLATSVDCYEIIRRGGDSSEVGPIGTMLARSGLYGEYLFATQWAKDHEYKHLYLFDADRVGNKDVSDQNLAGRRSAITDFIGGCSDMEFSRRLHLVEQWPIIEAPELWQEYIVDGDFEGLIFKNSLDSFGGPIGRMKRTPTMDYVLMDVEVSTSDSFSGIGKSLIGGLYIDGVLTEVVKVGGLDIEQRVEFLRHKDKYIGKVFEAKGKAVFKSGALRHPALVRFRDDKKPEECVW